MKSRGETMRRREFAASLGSLVMLPIASVAQNAIPFIGTPFSGEPGTPGPMRNVEGYRRGLLEMGYREGRDYRFEARYASYQFDRIPDLMRELQALKVAVVIVTNTELTTAAKVIE